MQIKTFIKQCKEHNLFKMLSIYVVSSWVILQVLSVTWQPLGLPQKSVTFLIIFLLVGLPMYLFFIWKYRIIPLEKERAAIVADDTDEKKPIKQSFQKYFFIASLFITTFCAFVIFLIIDKNFITNSVRHEVSETNKIAVLKFGNNTGDPKYDAIGKMASDWIIHGITENNLGQVISPDVISQYNVMVHGENSTKDERLLVKDFLKPSKIITGNYYLKNNKLVFQSTLSDGKTDETIISFKPQDCLDDTPLLCVENLEKSISGFLVTEDKKKLMLQDSPPNYEAYKLVLEARYEEYDEKYLALLNKAIAIDPNYFEAKVLRVAYFYNESNYKKADSLLKVLQPESTRNLRQVNLMNMYDAMLKGNNKKIYKTNLIEYNNAPYDLASNATTMVIALQFVNKIEEIDSIYNVIKMDNLYLQNCYDCVDRIYVKAFADIELKRYTEAIQLLEKAINRNNFEQLKKPYLIALIRNGNIEKVKSILEKAALTESPLFYKKLCFVVGKEYLMLDDEETAHQYFNKVVNSTLSKSEENAFTHLFIGDYSAAKTIFQDLIKSHPTNYELRIGAAITNFKNGDRVEAEKIINHLESRDFTYQYGAINYGLGQYYAVLGDEERMYSHLLKAIAAGHLYDPNSFQNDVFFKAYKNTKEFKQIMTFWH